MAASEEVEDQTRSLARSNGAYRAHRERRVRIRVNTWFTALPMANLETGKRWLVRSEGGRR